MLRQGGFRGAPVSGALHLDVFEQPEQHVFFSNLLIENALDDKVDSCPIMRMELTL